MSTHLQLGSDHNHMVSSNQQKALANEMELAELGTYRRASTYDPVGILRRIFTLQAVYYLLLCLANCLIGFVATGRILIDCWSAFEINNWLYDDGASMALISIFGLLAASATM